MVNTPIPIAVDTRHVRLTRAHYAALFGPKHLPTQLMTLGPAGDRQACAELVSVRGQTDAIVEVRVVLPEVAQSAVYLTQADLEQLGLAGEDRRRTPEGALVIEGPAGSVVLAQGIARLGHRLRMPADKAESLGLKHGQHTVVRFAGERARTFHHVVVEIDDGPMELRIEPDDANAVELKRNQTATWLPPDPDAERDRLDGAHDSNGDDDGASAESAKA